MNVSSEYNGVQPVIIPRARTQFIRAARPHKASDQCGRKYRVCITAFWHTRLPLRVIHDIPAIPARSVRPKSGHSFEAVGRRASVDPMSVHAAGSQRARHVDDAAAAQVIGRAQFDELAAQLRELRLHPERRLRHGVTKGLGTLC